LLIEKVRNSPSLCLTPNYLIRIDLPCSKLELVKHRPAIFAVAGRQMPNQNSYRLEPRCRPLVFLPLNYSLALLEACTPPGLVADARSHYDNMQFELSGCSCLCAGNNGLKGFFELFASGCTGGGDPADCCGRDKPKALKLPAR
jgi:hypothetical protein